MQGTDVHPLGWGHEGEVLEKAVDIDVVDAVARGRGEAGEQGGRGVLDGELVELGDAPLVGAEVVVGGEEEVVVAGALGGNGVAFGDD